MNASFIHTYWKNEAFIHHRMQRQGGQRPPNSVSALSASTSQDRLASMDSFAVLTPLVSPAASALSACFCSLAMAASSWSTVACARARASGLLRRQRASSASRTDCSTRLSRALDPVPVGARDVTDLLPALLDGRAGPPSPSPGRRPAGSAQPRWPAPPWRPGCWTGRRPARRATPTAPRRTCPAPSGTPATGARRRPDRLDRRPSTGPSACASRWPWRSSRWIPRAWSPRRPGPPWPPWLPPARSRAWRSVLGGAGQRSSGPQRSASTSSARPRGRRAARPSTPRAGP